MNLKALFCGLSIVGLASANAASVLVQNLNESGTAAHSIFDTEGALLPAVPLNNVRIGAFASGFNAQAAWDGADISALNSNFSQFGSTGNMLLDTGEDGLLQSFFSSADTSLADLPIIIWITNTGDFSSSLSQHLIFRFNASFSASISSNQTLNLSYSTGSLLAGAYGNFSHDYGFGALPGFNLEAVVPEPATYALLIGVALAGIIAVRCRKTRSVA